MTYRTAWQLVMDCDRRRQIRELRDLNHELQLGFARLRKAKLELEIITGKPYEPVMPLSEDP